MEQTSREVDVRDQDALQRRQRETGIPAGIGNRLAVLKRKAFLLVAWAVFQSYRGDKEGQAFLFFGRVVYRCYRDTKRDGHSCR